MKVKFFSSKLFPQLALAGPSWPWLVLNSSDILLLSKLFPQLALAGPSWPWLVSRGSHILFVSKSYPQLALDGPGLFLNLIRICFLQNHFPSWP